jgi:putative flippase GtrA
VHRHLLRGVRLFTPCLRWGSLFRKLYLYTVIGAIAFSTDYSIFLGVFTVGSSPYFANILGICGGIFVSFTLNRRYNFQRRDAVAKRATKFVAVALFGMALSSVIIALLIRQSVDPRVGKIVAMLVVFVAQFAANAFWTFR